MSTQTLDRMKEAEAASSSSLNTHSGGKKQKQKQKIKAATLCTSMLTQPQEKFQKTNADF